MFYPHIYRFMICQLHKQFDVLAFVGETWDVFKILQTENEKKGKWGEDDAAIGGHYVFHNYPDYPQDGHQLPLPFLLPVLWGQ